MGSPSLLQEILEPVSAGVSCIAGGFFTAEPPGQHKSHHTVQESAGQTLSSPSLMGTTVIAVAGSTVERFLASGGPGKTGFWSHLAPNLLNHLEPGFLCPRALVSGVMVKLYPLLMEEAPIFPVFS